MPGHILPYRGVTPRIHPDAFIAETATIIGDVEIGPNASVWYGCVLRGDANKIRVGAGTNLQDGTIVHVNHDRSGDYRETGGGMPTLIGDNVTVGHQVLIHACTIESNAFVGMAAVVMDGAVVEGQAMVAAGALVTPGKRVAKGELWAGRPAKLMRTLTAEELAELPYLAEHYQETAASYMAERTG
ncbi:gamma carbonic anhydrase family protein [Pelagibius litoralis]|uniref:Gamma carbonic anhydrase family protein n=1 Tax=Pelagibius litoralis TaxID=374515 RepID=A0A967EUF0_9PROT|nr:gamma carbonic anhydrase family protein [Pelagibius litoralis]NIA67071.1 gamma carbonic anhydrase family protein [Pelagibius litoralis]